MACIAIRIPQLPNGSVGIVVASGEQIIAMDLFDSPQTFASLWGRLGDAYFFDALRRPELSGKTDRKLAQHFVEGVAASAKSQPSTLGLGDEIEINEDGIVGTGLIYSERVCHMAAFSNSHSPGNT